MGALSTLPPAATTGAIADFVYRQFVFARIFFGDFRKTFGQTVRFGYQIAFAGGAATGTLALGQNH